jgi:hypothetical protein
MKTRMAGGPFRLCPSSSPRGFFSIESTSAIRVYVPSFNKKIGRLRGFQGKEPSGAILLMS